MKIINLSLSKSGTTSLEHTLADFYKVSFGHWNTFDRSYHMGLISNSNFKDLNIINYIKKSEYTVFSDAPYWSKKLFNQYINEIPDSYFIFIYREPHKWTTSLFNQLKVENNDSIDIIFERIKNKSRLPEIPVFPFYYFILSEFDIKDKFNFEEIKNKYEKHIEYTINFFENQSNIKFLSCDLEDPTLNLKIKNFLNLPHFTLKKRNITK